MPIEDERAGHLSYLRTLAAVLTSVAETPADLRSWRVVGAPPWPTDALEESGVLANFHLAQTAILSCSNHCQGIVALASGLPAPMLAVGALARSAVEAAAQAWWLRRPLSAAEADVARSVWDDLGSRAASVAACWYRYSASHQRQWLAATDAGGAVEQDRVQLAEGADLAAEAAKKLRDASGLAAQFGYGAAAVELISATGLRAGAAFYARMCEASHGNPLAVTRSEVQDAYVSTGLMPLTVTPTSTEDEEPVNVYLLMVIRCVEVALLTSFGPSTGRHWGLSASGCADVVRRSEAWQRTFR